MRIVRRNSVTSCLSVWGGDGETTIPPSTVSYASRRRARQMAAWRTTEMTTPSMIQLVRPFMCLPSAGRVTATTKTVTRDRRAWVVERVDVRIRGEILRYQDAREVSVCIALSKPPPSPFDLSSVTEDTGWPRSKAVRHGWIERKRVDDLLHGLWDQDGRRFSMLKRRVYKHATTVWLSDLVYRCECGPEEVCWTCLVS